MIIGYSTVLEFEMERDNVIMGVTYTGTWYDY
jgi:hypothetical protein